MYNYIPCIYFIWLYIIILLYIIIHGPRLAGDDDGLHGAGGDVDHAQARAGEEAAGLRMERREREGVRKGEREGGTVRGRSCRAAGGAA